MYQIASIDPDNFPKLKIRNQAKILELTGSKFDPIRAYEIIKQETQGFTQANLKAAEADALYAELLKLNGIAVKEKVKAKPPGNTVRIREQERSRALKLLELELVL